MIYVTLFFTLPLILALLTPLLNVFSKGISRFINPFIYLSGIMSGFITYNLISSSNIVLNLGNWENLFAINLYVSPLSVFAGTLIYLFALVISLYDLSSQRESYYYMLYNLFIFANITLLMSADFFNIFVLFEIASIASISLIAKGRGQKGSFGALKYMIVSSIASLIMLGSVGLLYSSVGSLNIAKVMSSDSLAKLFGILVGAGILILFLYHSEIFPFNSWVAEAYNSSSYSFAASLAGIGGITGSLVLARLYITVYSSPYSAFYNVSKVLGIIIAVCAIIGTLLGELSALKEKNIKRLLAFSSIGQMGLFALALIVGNKTGLKAGLLIVLSHSICKVILIMTAGFFSKISGSNNWKDMKGIARVYPLLGVIFALASLSLMGIPLFMGFWGKLGLLLNLIMDKTDSVFYLLKLIAFSTILFTAVIEGVYFIRLSHNFFEESETKFEKKNCFGLVLLGLIFSIFIIAVGIYPDMLNPILDKISSDLLNFNQYIKDISGIEVML